MPRLYYMDSETHAAEDLTHALINPTPTIPLTTLRDNQTAALRKIAEIFNKAAPPQVTPPPRVHTPEKTPDADPVPPPRVDPHGDITSHPVYAPRQPPQRLPHVIPYDTKPLPPVAHQKAAETYKIPTQHRYNTREKHLQGQDLIANHVATINTPPYKPSKPAPLVRLAGEDWAVINQVTGNLVFQPRRANAVIYTKTGKSK